MSARLLPHRILPALLPIAVATVAAAMFVSTDASATDWTRFRGPNGSGVSPDDKAIPEKFSDTESLKWKVELPGPGTSSPIVIGDRVVVTCWTGYGMDRNDPGNQKDLKRVVVCLNRVDGKILWQHEEAAVLPEDQYGGMFAEHGYTSHTPVTDGENVYAFFGKSGVVGLKLSDGSRLWQTRLGDGLEQRGWGSASSPVLYEDLVIVPALIEGDSVVALNKKTGEVAWKQEAPGYDGTWATPIIVKVDAERTDIVLAVPGEVWGLNPENGKLRWFCEVPTSDSARASVIEHEGVIYAMGGSRGGGCVAIRSGGKGDVSKTHLLWENGSDNSGIGSPLLFNGRLYLVAAKLVTVLDAATGKRIEQLRLRGTAAPATDAAGGGDQVAGNPREQNRGGAPGGRGGAPGGAPPEGGPGRGAPGGGGRPGQGGGFGGFGGGYGGGRGGPGGGQDYSSPVAAGGKMIYASRNGDLFVVQLGDKAEQISANQFASDRSDYSASPAIADGEVFIRSSKAIYCVSAK